jgi:hypothetical protein
MSHQPDNSFAGTQVVSLVAVRGPNHSLVHPRGAAGEGFFDNDSSSRSFVERPAGLQFAAAFLWEPFCVSILLSQIR